MILFVPVTQYASAWLCQGVIMFNKCTNWKIGLCFTFCQIALGSVASHPRVPGHPKEGMKSGKTTTPLFLFTYEQQQEKSFILQESRRSVTHAKNKSTVPHVVVLEIKTYRVSKGGPFRTSDRVINSDKFSVITNILHVGVTRHVLHVSAWCLTTSGANGIWRLWVSQTKQKFVLLFCRDNSSFVC